MKKTTLLMALGAWNAGATPDGMFAKSVWKASTLKLNMRDTFTSPVKETNSNLSSPAPLTNDHHRNLADDANTDLELACDQAFFKCMPNIECVTCFSDLSQGEVDWATVTEETPCTDVIDYLTEKGYCNDLKKNNAGQDAFCAAFNACVPWYESKDKPDNGDGGNSTDVDIDCSILTECNWEGFHRGFLGDGICHENYPGCYNTKICNYDGGDCCEDTCKDDTSIAECGHDGYACRDPKSTKCDPSLSSECPGEDDADGKKTDDADDVSCASDETKYRLVMFDSFGDGWDLTKLSISPENDSSNVIFSGGLKDGAQGTEYICLSSSSTCYQVNVGGGIWGNEVSWEIRPLSEGTKSLAEGSSPMDCTFSVAGTACERTCSGKSNVDPTDDPEYKTYKELYTCIQEKCLIQVGVCMAQETCAPCFAEDSPDYCFANDSFNAVIDCGLCKCTDTWGEFCTTKKASPGAVIPSNSDQPDKKPCTSAETLQGSNAVLKFSNCTDFDEVAMMVTDFDTNNFGTLDTFEACAHSYNNDPGHGGKTAMFCMNILYEAINADISDDDEDPTSPKEAISALAGLVYNNAQEFCECANAASDLCPLCPSFIHFKTLLYESLDACKSLDEIDCAAWSEFQPKCKANLEDVFDRVDFSNKAQCDYVKTTCGDAGPFPAFRRLDCGGEISKASWDFYKTYARDCLQGDDGIPPSESPGDKTPAPTPPPSKGGGGSSVKTPIPTAKPYVPDGGGGYKPYVPSNDDDDTGSDSKPKTSHFWRNILIMGVLGGGGYWYYKRHSESFSFIRYRQAPRNFGGSDGNTLYNGLAMESGASNFEPPSLPPPPSAMGFQPQQYPPAGQSYPQAGNQ